MIIVVSLSIFRYFFLEISLEKIDFLTVSNVDSLDFGCLSEYIDISHWQRMDNLDLIISLFDRSR